MNAASISSDIPTTRAIKRSGHARMTYGEFVVSRNLESGVQAMDMAHALGRPQRAHPATEAVITGILDGLLGEPLPDPLPWDASTYILTGTGRRELDEDDQATLGALALRFPLLR